MTKDLSKQGETTSAPQEIQKLPRSLCARCGLRGPVTMVKNGRCVNERACVRRQKKTEGGL